jgi:hypothetical protein
MTCIDIQEGAIFNTTQRLLEHSIPPRVEYVLGSHETFPENIEKDSVSCIVYNLGYLPGSDKIKRTYKETTEKSLLNALPLIKGGGVLSVMAYRGHEEGADEVDTIEKVFATLPFKFWRCSSISAFTRPNSPVQYMAYKIPPEKVMYKKHEMPS